jgi:glycosyltransferase involved in cell wall biosynthesis
MDLPAHVTVRGTSTAGFRHAMAGARLVVVPMQAELLHSGGQQTLLNAMTMGKPVIAVGRPWASDFLTDGVNGLIVDHGDRAGLRRAIAWVLEHPDEAAEMARRGQAHAQRFTTSRCMMAIHRLALGLPPIAGLDATEADRPASADVVDADASICAAER